MTKTSISIAISPKREGKTRKRLEDICAHAQREGKTRKRLEEDICAHAHGRLLALGFGGLLFQLVHLGSGALRPAQSGAFARFLDASLAAGWRRGLALPLVPQGLEILGAEALRDGLVIVARVVRKRDGRRCIIKVVD